MRRFKVKISGTRRYTGRFMSPPWPGEEVVAVIYNGNAEDYGTVVSVKALSGRRHEFVLADVTALQQLDMSCARR